MFVGSLFFCKKKATTEAFSGSPARLFPVMVYVLYIVVIF